jgi:ribose 5-phosphate isomerase A
MSYHMTSDDQKRAAASRATDLVEPGMALGLGSGSTAEHFVRELGLRVRQGLKVRTTATSERTEALAREAGITVMPLDQLGTPDLTVDGADEVDGELRLIKGGGGALLREKIVAAASKKMVVIADGSKRVETLGVFPLPVEVVSFAPQTIMRAIAEAAARTGCRGNLIRLRGGEHPVRTDQGNLIADIDCEFIPHPDEFARALAAIPGVVEHGLFIGLCRTLILGHATGVEVIER